MFTELLIPSESALKMFYFDVRFKTVHSAKVKLWPLNLSKVVGSTSRVKWPFRQNGAEQIYTALAKVAFVIEMCFTVKMTKQMPYNVDKIKNNKFIKW